MNTFLKLTTISFIIALSSANVYADTAKICQAKKIATISASDKKNKVGIDYETFVVKYKTSRKNSFGNEKEYEYKETFFIFDEANLNLMPKNLNIKKLELNCSEISKSWDDKDNYSYIKISEPFLLTNDKKYLVMKYFFQENMGKTQDEGFFYYDIETQTEMKIDAYSLPNNFKDENYIISLVEKKLKEDNKYYQCMRNHYKNSKVKIHYLLNVYLVENSTTNQIELKTTFSDCGKKEISFTKQEINPFLKTDSVLYKILNN